MRSARKVPAQQDLTEDPKILNESETAALLKMTVRNLRELRYNGDGPPSCRINRKVLYRRSSVLLWFASIESKPRASAWKVRERENRLHAAAAEAASAGAEVQS